MARLRLLLAGDLHYPGDPRLLWLLLRRLARGGYDALLLAGDVLGSCHARDAEKLAKLLRRHTEKPVAMVWGNHEHYLPRRMLAEGATSTECLQRLHAILSRHHIHVLDADGPLDLGPVAVTGNVGWHDNSLAPQGYTMEDYLRCNPYRTPLPALQRCEKNPTAGCPPRWRRDCIYIRLPTTHQDYAHHNAKKLDKWLAETTKPTIVLLHHVPRPELLADPEDLDAAYAGSTRLGETIRRHHDKILAVAYGHLHRGSRKRIHLIDGIPHINTYPAYTEPPTLVAVDVDAKKKTVELHVERLTSK